MPAKTINMHGKIYNLSDEKIRTKEQALKFAAELRTEGKVAFLNPQKRKGQATNFWVYEAEKTIRTSKRSSVSATKLLEEYKKGSESFGKFMEVLEQSQKEVVLEVVKESPKEVPKETPKKDVPKKVVPNKETSKKNGKKNGKKK